MVSKIYTDEGGIKLLYQALSTCERDDPLAKARQLPPDTRGQTMDNYHIAPQEFLNFLPGGT